MKRLALLLAAMPATGCMSLQEWQEGLSQAAQAGATAGATRVVKVTTEAAAAGKAPDPGATAADVGITAAVTSAVTLVGYLAMKWRSWARRPEAMA